MVYEKDAPSGQSAAVIKADDAQVQAAHAHAHAHAQAQAQADALERHTQGKGASGAAGAAGAAGPGSYTKASYNRNGPAIRSGLRTRRSIASAPKIDSLLRQNALVSAGKGPLLKGITNNDNENGNAIANASNPTAPKSNRKPRQRKLYTSQSTHQ